MNYALGWRHGLAGLLVFGVLLALLTPNIPGLLAQDSIVEQLVSAPFDTPMTSSPITLSQDKNFIWVVNPDDGSVSVLGDLDANPHVLKTIKNVGREPQAVALDTTNHAYVASPANNGVFIVDITNSNVNTFSAVARKDPLITGAEPWNLVAAPDGARIFVANSGQDTISVIRTSDQTIVGSVDLKNSLCNVDDKNRHFQPRGLAVTQDGTRLYVARFLSFTKSGGVQGVDGDKEGVVCQLNIPADVATLPTVANVVRIAAMDSGFKQPDGKAAISHPNQMQSIVIYRDQIYLPNIGAATAGPDRFNSSTMAHVNVIDNANADNVGSDTPTDAPTKSVNLHLGARKPEPGKDKLFFANPWAIGFRNNNGTVNAYAVSAGSDILAKLNVDATGDLTFTVGVSTTRYIDLNPNDSSEQVTFGRNAGKNPLGIAMRNNKAFVMNYISRNVSIVNLDSDVVEKVIETTALPSAGSFDEQLLVGKEIFFASRGHFDRPQGTTVSTDDRLSNEGWQNCASCHFAGNTDGNVWFFGSGPRKSVPLNATWSPHNPDDQRLLNYSAIFDEVQDFENNIRNTSGPLGLNVQGKPPVPCAFLPPPAPSNTISQTAIFDPNHGLLFGDDGDINKSICALPNFIPFANAGRKQLSVTLPGSNKAWPALDSMKEWVRFSIRTPEGALTTNELPGNNQTGALPAADVNGGRRLFFQAGCQKCHGGSKWTISNKDFVSPPAAAEVPNEAPASTGATQLQFFNRVLRDIGSFNLNVAGQGNILPGQPAIGAVEVNNGGLKALGFDHNGDGKGIGYNVPALLGINAMPPYYHNGACETLACVLSNEKHRKAGNADDPIGNDVAKQAKVVAFLQSLDADTRFPLDLRVFAHDIFLDPPTVLAGQPFTIGVNVSLFGGKPDLLDLASDVNATTLTVRFQVGNDTPIDVTFAPADFAQDFGQARVIKAGLTAPAAGVTTLSAEIDPGNQLPEDKEDNNKATRRLRTRTPPPDRTPPVVNAVFISDDANFNDNDAIATSRNVKVKIKATDPAGPGSEVVSGLDAYCLVRYTYNVILRRWVEEACTFKPLPAPETGTTDTFIVDTELKAKEGVAYAFAWVRDGAGNISRQPGFDVISYIPTTEISLDRNDIRIFRIPLASGSLTLNFVVKSGDIDVSVFDDFTNANATRCGLSANNGPVDESISLPGNCPASPGRFQVEVRAAVNSRFTIAVSEAATVAAAGVTVSAVPLADEKPLVGGPPARQTAIEDEGGEGILYLPVIIK